jgi:dTDP-4-amino-4,6-dideoxygalactose transaminase
MFHFKGKDEVISTPMAFITSFNTIIHIDTKPVLVDIN